MQVVLFLIIVILIVICALFKVKRGSSEINEQKWIIKSMANELKYEVHKFAQSLLGKDIKQIAEELNDCNVSIGATIAAYCKLANLDSKVFKDALAMCGQKYLNFVLDTNKRSAAFEKVVQKWLDSKNIKYRTEEDLKLEGSQLTPDFLIDDKTPLIHKGINIKWIDAKNYPFHKYPRMYCCKNYAAALKYTNAFGAGMFIFNGSIIDLDIAHLGYNIPNQRECRNIKNAIDIEDLREQLVLEDFKKLNG